jgi:hypothetical protein
MCSMPVLTRQSPSMMNWRAALDHAGFALAPSSGNPGRLYNSQAPAVLATHRLISPRNDGPEGASGGEPPWLSPKQQLELLILVVE